MYKVVNLVRGYNPVHHLKGAIVAGSYARWCAGFGDSYGDIDIFLLDTSLKPYIESLEIDNVHIITNHGYPYTDAKSLIDNFPISLQMAALIGKDKVLVSEELLEDAPLNQFRLMTLNNSALRSYYNYINKGYKCI